VRSVARNQPKGKVLIEVMDAGNAEVKLLITRAQRLLSGLIISATDTLKRLWRFVC